MDVKVSKFNLSKLKKPTPTKAFHTYWKFAAERQNIFYKSVNSSPNEKTKDCILSTYKFTNAYRASDRVSQYLIKNVIYSGKYPPEDTFFRILLFKIFNKINTWEMFEHEFGDISIANFNIRKFNKVLDFAMASGAPIYSAAYIIPSGPSAKYKGVRKHLFHLELIQSLIKQEFFHWIQDADTLMEIYNALLEIESFGKFLSYQFAIDFNYSECISFSENEFVIPGPGAKDGIRKCFSDFGDYTEPEIIRMMVDEQNNNFGMLNLNFQSLWGRNLHLIDCQNLFCEVDKYSRVAHPEIEGLSKRTRIKQKYKRNPSEIHYYYPPKWGINSKIKRNF